MTTSNANLVHVPVVTSMGTYMVAALRTDKTEALVSRGGWKFQGDEDHQGLLVSAIVRLVGVSYNN